MATPPEESTENSNRAPAPPSMPEVADRSLAQMIEAHAPCLTYLGVTLSYGALDA